MHFLPESWPNLGGLVGDHDLAASGGAEAGASVVEYILLVALIAIVVTTAVLFLSGRIGDNFNDAGNAVNGGTSVPAAPAALECHAGDTVLYADAHEIICAVGGDSHTQYALHA